MRVSSWVGHLGYLRARQCLLTPFSSWGFYELLSNTNLRNTALIGILLSQVYGIFETNSHFCGKSTSIIMRFSLFLLLGFCFAISSCSGPQEPEIRRVENVRTTKFNTNEIVIIADLIGFNPNPVGGTVIGTDVIVTVNGVETAAVLQNKDADVVADSEFTIPLTCSISPSQLFKENRSGLLGGVLNAMLDKKVDVQFDGNVKIKVAGLTFEEPIDHQEEIQIK